MTRRLALPLLFVATLALAEAQPTRTHPFRATTERDAERWRRDCRARLFELMMGGAKPQAVGLLPKLLTRAAMPAGGYGLEELTLQTLPDRRVHAWLAAPTVRDKKVGAVLVLHGHGGSGEDAVRGRGLYWYGRALAEMGYVVLAPDIGSHDLQHTNWSLMGERVWDALRCVDYLVTRPEVDHKRIAVAGLSLGGETAMYVGALDDRVKLTCSSGWLTTVENMKQGHCPCWRFAGLEEHFDFADVFACIAPRGLVCEVGAQEKAPGGFPVSVARQAFAEIESAYRVCGAGERLALTVHSGGHVFNGREFWPRLYGTHGPAYPWNHHWSPADRSPTVSASSTLAQAEDLRRRGEIARRNFTRALGVLDGWWKLCDPATGLFPRRTDQPVWAPQDNAADMLPFLAITAHYLAPERLPGILDVIPKERALTTRQDGLPDWFGFTNRSFVYPAVDMKRLIFGAAEYCKDGLTPMTEVMGRGPWTDRMIELMDAIFARAPVASDFGPLPADDSEVNGDLLQVLARLYAMTRDEKYTEWAERIGDAYCLEVLPHNGGLPPHRWDFTKHQVIEDRLNLNDHGNELVGGLAELYVITRAHHPAKAERYQAPLQNLFSRLLDKARNPDGLWCNLLRASTGEVLNPETPDTWGYALSATATFGRTTGLDRFTQAAQQGLRGIHRPRYLDWNGADSYADSIEGALLLLNRYPEPAAFEWLEAMLPLFLGKQRDDGIVEGWYGDGNYARTALMAGLYYTQGAMCQPWRSDLQFGAVREGKTLKLALTADQDWEGRLVFDTPRHRLHLRLPTNYPRLNEFPEWFTVDPAARYRLRLSPGEDSKRSGAELAKGVSLKVKTGQTVIVRVTQD